MQSENIQTTKAFRIDNIEIIDSLGSGGMSQVFKARQLQLDRIVAVKFLSATLAVKESSIERFKNEAKLASVLDHPNIVRTLSYGVSADGNPYIVMEYIEGMTLAERLATGGVLTLQEFKDIFIPLLSALAHAHEKGLVHRDIKPGNIMLCKNQDELNNVKLLDFGVAKIFDDSQAQQGLTKTGAILGSPNYMSPEQCIGGAVDGRTDIYSLCCVMFESLCGEPVFIGSTAYELMQKHGSEAPPTVSEWSRKIDIRKELASIVLSGLAKDPAARPQSAAEFSKALGSVLDKVTLDNKVPRVSNAMIHRSPAKIAALVVFVLLALATATQFLSSRTGKNTNLVSGPGHSQNSTELGEKALAYALDGKLQKSLELREMQIAMLKAAKVRKQELIYSYKAAASLFLRGVQLKSSNPEMKDLQNNRGAIWYFRQALNLAKKSNNSFELGDCFAEIASSIPPLELEPAGNELIRELEDSRPAVDAEGVIKTIHNLSTRCTSNGRADLGLKWSQRELEIARRAAVPEKSIVMLRAKCNKALALAYLGKRSECDSLVRKVAEEVGDCCATIGLRAGIYVEYIFESLKETKSASLAGKIFDEEMAKHGDLYANTEEYSMICYSVGKVYRSSVDFKKAAPLLESARIGFQKHRAHDSELAESLGYLIEMSSAHSAEIGGLAKKLNYYRTLKEHCNFKVWTLKDAGIKDPELLDIEAKDLKTD